jgi:RNA polymerase sigma-70 factor (ECF subfamily)
MYPPVPDPNTLAELLARAGAGDSRALGELLRRYERRVHLAARALLRPALRNVLDSIDLVQSVHRALLPGLQDGRYAFADEEQLVALAVTVLRHKVQRTAKRPPPAPTDPATLPPEQSPEASPPDAAVGEELAAKLLAGLDPEDRQIVEFRMQDFSTPEIAARLGVSPAVLRARLSRLRKRLRDAGFDEWV